MKKRYFIIAAIILLIATFAWTGYNVEKANYENEIQRLYNTRIVELEKQLEMSRLERRSALDSINSLNRLYKDVLRRDSIEQDSLKRVPGKFKSLNSQQLQNKMVEEFNKRGQ